MISILISSETDFHLLYSAKGFEEGLTVTGYFIYPNFEKSDVFTFDELGDGVYSTIITHNQQSNSYIEKNGLVIKENGIVKKFEIVQISFS